MNDNNDNNFEKRFNPLWGKRIAQLLAILAVIFFTVIFLYVQGRIDLPLGP